MCWRTSKISLIELNMTHVVIQNVMSLTDKLSNWVTVGDF